jgi:hypothetical protein
MRTTLNLDDDVAALVSARAGRQGRSLSRVVNDLVRAGLQATNERPELPPYDPPTFDTGRPRLDVTDVAAALAVLDDG